MPAMIRKQIYIEPRHDKLLKQLAKKTGATEAELIRKAIDQYVADRELRQKRDTAWEAEKAFIKHWIKNGPQPETRKWTRDELYDRQSSDRY